MERALAAAMSTASALGLTVDDAIVLHDSNKLSVRLLPCDVLARVAPTAHQVAQFEVELAQRLAETGSPVAALEPRVEPRAYERDGFAVTPWTYYNPVAPREVSPADYAAGLERLHAGMRKLDVRTPHFTDRVAEAQHLVESSSLTPELAAADRELLINTIRSRRQAIGGRGAAEQLLHGEPHPGNVSSISRRVAAGPSSSTSPMSPKMSASAMRTLMKNCSVSAGSLFLPWSPRGAGIRATNSRTGNEQLVNSSALYARVRRGRRSTRDAPTGWSVGVPRTPGDGSLLEPPPGCGHTPTPLPGPPTAPKLSVPPPNLTTKPETTPVGLHRIPDAAVACG